MENGTIARVSRARRVVRALPWIAILVINGTVQLIRDAPVDAVVFAAVAVLIALDAAGVLPPPPAVRLPLGAMVIGGVLAALTKFVGQYETSWHYVFGVSIVAIVPVVVLFMLIEKRLVGGLTAGAVK